ncbi:hypothetical protein NPIL_102421 [Nephila pilipes]|uniref:Uncharacterized protein n=1 Tax=Nephila pilipes TaxID=299642 RepID=A0A8X6T178_NEPPI|nr:hypothetical protein NPIL_102421 [Nephila pilipes]
MEGSIREFVSQENATVVSPSTPAVYYSGWKSHADKFDLGSPHPLMYPRQKRRYYPGWKNKFHLIYSSTWLYVENKIMGVEEFLF